MIAPTDDSVRRFFKGIYTSDTFRYEDPTYLGFSIHFNFDPTHRDPEMGITQDALWAEDQSLDSAQAYLRNIGLEQNAVALKKFKEMLKYMTKYSPYYFQGITGISDLWKMGMTGADFDSARAADKKITIDCLESVDMRMTAIADLYRTATFDKKFMRSILPDNLRWFTMTVRIAEMRNFHALKTALESNEPTGFTRRRPFEQIANDPLQLVQKMTSVVEFKLERCYFDFEESFGDEFMSNLDGTEMTTQKFSVIVGNIKQSSVYDLLDMSLSEFFATDNNGNVTDHSLIGTDGLKFGEGDSPQDPASIRPIVAEVPLGSRVRGWNGSSTDRFAGVGTAIRGGIDNLGNQLSSLPSQLAAGALDSLASRFTGAALGNVYDGINRSITENINQFLRSDDQISGPLGNVYD